TWRNFFLVGAQELQNNVPLQNTSDPSDLLIHTPTERFLEAMATNLDVENLKNENQCINLVLSDTKEHFSLWVENSVMQFKRYDENSKKISEILVKNLQYRHESAVVNKIYPMLCSIVQSYH
ncbi:hypothetical protein OQ641_29955, partial [Klebsiella pneumoniae]|uniref:alkyl sulfatase C-terminal domain-containing protein n=1 Tax=Klebsiella pneumoniae TaxID=573 RepID=UPI002AFDEC1F